VPDVSPRLADLVARTQEPLPQARFPDMNAAVAELEAALAVAPPTIAASAPAPAPQRPSRKRSRPRSTRWIVLAVALPVSIACAAIVGVAIAVATRPQPRARAETEPVTSASTTATSAPSAAASQAPPAPAPSAAATEADAAPSARPAIAAQRWDGYCVCRGRNAVALCPPPKVVKPTCTCYNGLSIVCPNGIANGACAGCSSNDCFPDMPLGSPCNGTCNDGQPCTGKIYSCNNCAIVDVYAGTTYDRCSGIDADGRLQPGQLDCTRRWH
jgi:hypothetical protein